MALKSEPMAAVFVDRLTVWSLLRIAATKSASMHLYYIDLSSQGKRAFQFLRRVGAIRADLRPFEYFLGELRGEDGQCLFVEQLSTDVRELSLRILREVLENDLLVASLGKVLGRERCLFFFTKLLAAEIEEPCVQINAVEWFLRTQGSAAAGHSVFLVRHRWWFKYLKTYAASLGVRLEAYREPHSPVGAWGRPLVKVIGFLIRGANPRAGSGSRGAPSRLSTVPEPGQPRTLWGASGPPLVAFHPSVRKISFDPKDSSEFFWFPDSQIPGDQVLVYFTRSDVPATEEAASYLQAHGIRAVAMAPGATRTPRVPVWRRTELYEQTRRQIVRAVLKNLVAPAARGPRLSARHLPDARLLIDAYAFWYDFFVTNRVRIQINNYDWIPTNMAAEMAIEAAQGISVSYQYTVGSGDAKFRYAPSAHVVFGFSTDFERALRLTASPTEHVVVIGFPFDRAISAVRARAAQRRAELKKAGADFIICYFDENSSNHRNGTVSHGDLAEDYTYLLTRLLADDSLGLVLKPKKPLTLSQRIAGVRDLMERAHATGRCLVLDGGGYTTDVLPTEAAQVADIAVGKIVGRTATLESYLSGVPTLLLDKESWHSSPFYPWGRNTVVFENWDDLFAAVMRYRDNPASAPGFGDWSPLIERLDAFRDGKAGMRMGQYLRSLMTALEDGASGEAAMSSASAQFAAVWGSDKSARLHASKPAGSPTKVAQVAEIG